jgi:hypothetical protein
VADSDRTRPLSASYVTGAKIAELFNKHDGLTKDERTEIERTRKLIARELRAPMPEELGIGSEEDGLGVSLPDATVVPLQTVNRVGRRRPRVKRPTKGVAPRMQQRATKIEQPLNSLMSKLYPWTQTVDLIVNEAQCLVITQPEPTHWARRPRRYELDDDGTEDKGRVRRPYRVDDKDRDESDGEYRNTGKPFRVDERKSAAAYEDDLREYLAENPPFIQRAFSRREFAPINPRYVGTTLELDGVVVKQKYTATQLIQRDFIWPKADQLLSEDPGGEVTLYEAWLTDADGSPYVAYHVEGAEGETKRWGTDGEQRAAVVNLKAEYGICRLPVAYRYGLCFPGAEPGRRGVPLMAPFESALLLEDSMASSKVVHAYNFGFGGWFHAPDASAGPDSHVDAEGNPIRIEVRPNSITMVPPGTITPAVHAGTNHDVTEVLSLTRGVVDDNTPNPEQDGAGYAQLISRSGVAESMDQVYDAIRELFEVSASHLLEAVCAFGEKFRPVVVALDEDRAAQDNEGPAELVEVEPGLAGGNYRVLAVFPPEENMPLRQQEAEFVERGLMTRREFHERRGVEDPEAYDAELMIEKLTADEDRGWPEILRIAATITGDEAMKEQLELLEAQKISPTGDPLAAIQAGLQGPGGVLPSGPPQGAPPSMTGMGGPSAAQSSLAGVIGGAMQAQPRSVAAGNGVAVPPGAGGI